MLRGAIMKYPEKIFNTTSAFVMIFNRDEAIVWLNDVCERALGYRLSDLQGDPPWPFFANDDQKKVTSLIRQTLNETSPDSLDIPVRCAGKPIRKIRWNTLLVRDDENPSQKSVVFLGTQIRGVEQKKLDLEAAEERYRLLFENTGIGMMYVGEDMTIALVNKEFEKLTGYPKAQVEDKMNWTELIAHEHDLERMKYLHRLRRVDPAVAPGVYDAKFRKRNGEIRDGMIQVIMIPETTYSLASFLDITEQKIAEETIRKSEEKYRELVDNIQDTLYRCDTGGNLTFTNPSGVRLLGYEHPEEVIGKNIAKDFYYHPDLRETFLEKLVAEGKVTDYVVTLKHRDGSPIIISSNSHLFYDREGNVLGVEGLFTDITHRKHSEEEIRRLAAIVRNSSEMVNLADQDGYIVFQNEAWAKTLGIDPENVRKTHILQVIPDHLKPLIQNEVLPALLKGESWEGDLQYINLKTGVLTDAHTLTFPIEDPDMTDRKYLANISLDISQRKLFEEKFTKVFMMTPNCVAITRISDGMIVDVNVGFEDMTGWKRSEAIDRTSLEINFWADSNQRSQMVEDLKAGRDILTREFNFCKKDGSVRNGIYSARSIQIGGEPHLVFVLQDITDQRRLEEDRRKLEQQLHQSQKMDAIGQLASGVAHDFNNILTGIQGNASLIMMAYDSEHPHYQKLSRIEENVMRGAKMTRQLLGFARGGKYEVKTLSVNDLVRKATQFFLETKKEIEADFQLQKDAYPVDADTGQMEQVLLNIYINAGHAMPEGGSLCIQTFNVTLPEADANALEIPAGDYVIISISDTGIGMDQQTLKKIFEPFFTTKLAQGGTGLGLASVYGIIRNHGGAIHADSEPGRGATFKIYLPSSREKVTHERRDISKGLISGSGTILLVDDEPMILGVASEMLKMLGYTVYLAGNGQEAVSIYLQKNHVIDLVILDMILPGISGAQVLKMIQEVNPNVRVILSSGYSMQGEVQKVMESGCQGFIQKPYKFDDLSNIVHQTMHAS